MVPVPREDLSPAAPRRAPLVRQAALVALIAAACGGGGATGPPIIANDLGPRPPPRTCGGPTPAAGAASVRDIDWCNHSYRRLVGDAEVVGGEYEIHVYGCDQVPGHEGEHVTEAWTLREVTYGDLDADGVEDVAISFYEYGFACRDEDDMRLTRIYTFRITDGRIVSLGEGTTGVPDDRALAVVPTLEIANGEIVRTYTWRSGGTCRDRWRPSAFGLLQLAPRCT